MKVKFKKIHRSGQPALTDLIYRMKEAVDSYARKYPEFLESNYVERDPYGYIRLNQQVIKDTAWAWGMNGPYLEYIHDIFMENVKTAQEAGLVQNESDRVCVPKAITEDWWY